MPVELRALLFKPSPGGRSQHDKHVCRQIVVTWKHETKFADLRRSDPAKRIHPRALAIDKWIAIECFLQVKCPHLLYQSQCESSVDFLV